MSCPFRAGAGGGGGLPPTSASETDDRGGGCIRRMGRSRGSKDSLTWDMGPSMDSPPGGGSASTGGLASVQERVSSYTKMTRSTSVPQTQAPTTVVRKTSGGYVRSRVAADQVDEQPLLLPPREPQDPNQHLSLQNLTEAVWSFITIPADNLLLALDALLRVGDQEWKALRRKLCIVAESVRDWDDWHLDDLLNTLINQLEVSQEEFLSRLGHEYVRECRRQYGKALESLGYNLEGFLTNLTGICDILKTNPNLTTKNDVPNLVCNRRSNTVILNFYTNRETIRHFVGGVIEGVGKQIFNKTVSVTNELLETPNGNRTSHRWCFRYSIHESLAQDPSLPGLGEYHGSRHAKESKIGMVTFCKAFPWHFVCNKEMIITQMGSGLLQVFGPGPMKTGEEVSTCFSLLSPEGTALTYDSVIERINAAFILSIKDYKGARRPKLKNMELKGQMVSCEESDSLLFIGSPSLDGLTGLTSRGLFLSDIPIHDATRDVILVGEQARAQDGLKRRLANLKHSIEDANNAVDQEREKNISLLHLIFPPDIAKRLWLGEVIEAQKHEEVTMLFSDIVGFTSICSTATPLMVINMLQTLYTKFDETCGQLDIYKVETIGDAYCVAGNLHRRSKLHAQLVAWMALSMMESCKSHTAHDGRQIQMRIGLHTGPVLAGVVGTVMPRYCMFGANVTVANQFESTSEPLRINISPTTHRLLKESEGWSFTLRNHDCLPKGFISSSPSDCPAFLDHYKHPSVIPSFGVTEHIGAAIAHLNIKENIDLNGTV
ncbi:unnamed protein product, partial [Meganyctiphanes norvegica]